MNRSHSANPAGGSATERVAFWLLSLVILPSFGLYLLAKRLRPSAPA